MSEQDPPELVAAYEAAEGERAREAAALALARWWGELSRPAGRPYEAWLAAQRRYQDWFYRASGHRAAWIAQRVPDPHARPMDTPRVAAERYLWAHRSWPKEEACRSAGGQGADGYWVEARGGVIRVTSFKGQECHARFDARKLWDELFAPLAQDERPTQLALF